MAIFGGHFCEYAVCHVTLALRGIHTIYIGGSGGSMVTPGRQQERGVGLEEEREFTKGFI